MKKITTIILVLISVLVLASCDNEKEKSYSLFIDDENNYIINDLKEAYKPGEEIIIQAGVLIDASFALYINGVYHSIQTVVETNDGYIREYYFKMPNEDVTISFKIDGIPAPMPIIERIYLNSFTFAGDTYGYENVYLPQGSLLENKDYLEDKYNINLNDEIVVLEDLEALKEIYNILMGKEFETSVVDDYFIWIIVNRTAAGSQFIDIQYYFSFSEKTIGYFYPSGHEAGDAAMFKCIDLIKVYKEYPNLLENLEINEGVDISGE